MPILNTMNTNIGGGGACKSPIFNQGDQLCLY